MTVAFRCPPELEPFLPRPMPAVLGLPDWFKAMPPKAFNPSLGEDSQTLKRCPPFIDAMTYGFLIPLPTDLKGKGKGQPETRCTDIRAVHSRTL